jgi:hypothetical protein
MQINRMTEVRTNPGLDLRVIYRRRRKNVDPEVPLGCMDRWVALLEIERVDQNNPFREGWPRRCRTPEGDFQAALAGEGRMSRQRQNYVVPFRQFHWDRVRGA